MSPLARSEGGASAARRESVRVALGDRSYDILQTCHLVVLRGPTLQIRTAGVGWKVGDASGLAPLLGSSGVPVGRSVLSVTLVGK